MEELRKMREEMKEDMRRLRESGQDTLGRIEKEAQGVAREVEVYAQKTDKELREQARAARDRVKQDYEQAGEALVSEAERRAASQFAQTITIQPEATELLFFLYQVEEGALAHVLTGDSASLMMKELSVFENAQLLKAKRRLSNDLLTLKKEQLDQIEKAVDADAFNEFKSTIARVEVDQVFGDALSRDVAQLLAEFDGQYYDKYLSDAEKDRLGRGEIARLRLYRAEFRDDLEEIVQSRVRYLGANLSSFTAMYTQFVQSAVKDAKEIGSNASLAARYVALREAKDQLLEKIVIPSADQEVIKGVDRLIREYQVQASALHDDLKATDKVSQALDVSKWIDASSLAYLKAYTSAVVRLGLWTQWRVLHNDSSKIAQSVSEYEDAVDAYKKTVNAEQVRGRLGDVVDEYVAEVDDATSTVQEYERVRKQGGALLVDKRAEIADT